MIELEWHSEKERLNAQKHGLDMTAVRDVFSDPFRIAQYDIAHSGLEDRWQTLGVSSGVLFVVYTERGKKIRVISARRASPEERRTYYGTKSKGFWFIP